MLVKITNIGSDQFHLPAYGSVLDPGDDIETRRTMVDVEGDESLKALVLSGDALLAFTAEAGDSIATGFGAAPQSFSSAGRPDASTVPVFTWIYNTDDNAPNWSDGTDWRDAAGILT